MSSCEKEMKREIEDTFPPFAVKLENKDLVGSVALFNDGSLFMDPDMEFKAEPEIFESSEGDMKYSFDSDASVSEDDLKSYKKKVKKEKESVKTGGNENYGMQFESFRKEGKEKVRGRVSFIDSGKECVQKKEQIENSGCEKSLCRESDCNTHTDVGTREKSFVPGNYEKQFSGIVNLNTHMLNHTGGRFRCRECGEIFSKREDRKAHYETHTRSFKCNDCGKMFFQKHVLRDHYRIHTGEKPFKCDVCGKAFTMKSGLTEHHRIHTGEKPFKCEVCDKAFPQKNHLTKHYRVHTGEKPFKCDICSKGFSVKSCLTAHYIIHTGEKPFKCKVCDEAFSYKRKFSDHMRIHTGNAFRCSECGKEFTQKFGLTRHFRIHTGEKPYKCSDCGITFTWESCLSKHKKICARENL